MTQANVVSLGPAEIMPLKTVTVPPYTTTNTIIFGTTNLVVIDPGSCEQKEQEILKKHLVYRMGQGQKLFGIFLTHHHGDHCAFAYELASAFSLPIFAHKNASSQLKFSIDQFIDHDEIFNLDKKSSLKAIHTPGHSSDHLVFFDEYNGMLIAGDMITDFGTILIPPSGSLNTYLKSLEMLTLLPLKIIIPAHGLAITHKPHKFLLEALRHRYQRILAVLLALEKQDQAINATHITLLIYNHLSEQSMLAFAQLSVESSLQWLKENQLVQYDQGWQLEPHAHHLKNEAILKPLEQIDYRLRNA